ncbi:MAG TPA: type II toxin-antitoxin system HicB family antitoxin [Acetobacteraceae bacterium]|nr:type II toxin-antitoxin system HicB family antitoxin [Acetobacteraceae bacterium]
MTTRIYPALLIADKGRADAPIGVVFPDLPGCVSQGDDPQQAAEMALEALALHIEAMVQDGEDLPDPSPPGTIPDWINPRETRVLTHLLVPVELPGRSVRVNITMDENLLQRADRAAAAQGMTRSGLLAEAVRTWLRDGQRGKRRRAS